jgi:hypothetical protein
MTSQLNIKGGVNVDGSLVVNGENIEGKVGITTGEQATGEKFLGRDVYVKRWEGTVSTANHTLYNFFPSDGCGLVGIGGQSGNCFFPYSYTGYYRLAYQDRANLVFQYFSSYVGEVAKIWVKYVHPLP